jgi:hypothetical protein
MPSTPTPNNDQAKKSARIYAMPEKFFTNDNRGGGGGKNKVLIIMIIVLVVLLLAGGAYFVIQKYMLSNTNENENSNINIVTNSNTNNANTNKNSNSNLNTTNSNTDSALNVNLFANANTNLNTNTSLNTNTVVSASQDTDSDGLTDIEEGLYGTNVSIPDTDADGFSDGQEVANGYNPTGTGKLEDSSAVRLYTDSTDGYSLLYPATWVPSDDPQNTRGKMFTASGEFVEVSVQENPARLSARDWYLTKSPGIDSAQIMSMTNWNKTLSGVLSLDGLTAYYTKGDKAYMIAYNINILTQANYKTTFKMMYSSFVLGSTTTNTNQSNNSNTSANLNHNTNTSSNANHNTNTSSNLNHNSNTNTNTNNANSNKL